LRQIENRFVEPYRRAVAESDEGFFHIQAPFTGYTRRIPRPICRQSELPGIVF
jgi:hypothetical protein